MRTAAHPVHKLRLHLWVKIFREAQRNTAKGTDRRHTSLTLAENCEKKEIENWLPALLACLLA